MTDVEDEVCYSCTKHMREHSIHELYVCLAYFSELCRDFDHNEYPGILKRVQTIRGNC